MENRETTKNSTKRPCQPCLKESKSCRKEELSQVTAAQTKPAPKKRAKGTGRMSLPEELRREDIIIPPTECIEGCVKIGRAGSILVGMAGAKTGALIGAGIGSLFGGIGAIPGSVIGGVIGGFGFGMAAGYYGGQLGGKAVNYLNSR